MNTLDAHHDISTLTGRSAAAIFESWEEAV